MRTSGALRVVEREALAFRKLWKGSVFSTFLSPLLFLAAIGVGLGGLVDEGGGAVAGLPYLVFVTPGLMVAGAMQTSASESLWPVMSGTKWQRTFHGMVATPLGAGEVYTGFLLWTVVRATIFATAFVLVASLLGGVPSPLGVLAVPATVLCAAAFAAPLSAWAATQDSDAGFPLVMRVGVMPLFLFSGTFFPIEQLPLWLQRLAVLSPLWHGVQLARGATTGSVDVAAAAGHVVVLVAVVAAGSWWGTRTWSERLAR